MVGIRISIVTRVQSMVSMMAISIGAIMVSSFSTGISLSLTGTIAGYSQVWLRGEGPTAHVHEGIRMADGSGWVAIGNTLPEEKEAEKFQVLVRYVDNEAETQWSTILG